MKTLGILGGMSWESTIGYYRLLNEGIRQRCGGLHSAPLLMVSVDFAGIRVLMQEGRWDEAGSILASHAKKLEVAGAECMLIATNTMHKVAPAIEQAISIPLLHIVDPTAQALTRHAIRKVALLGTRYTMEDDFYKGRLHRLFGIEALVPVEKDRDIVDQIIFDELCLGKINSSSREQYVRIIHQLADQGAQAVILGCTEINLLIQDKDVSIPVFDTTSLHAEAAVNFCIGNTQ